MAIHYDELPTEQVNPQSRHLDQLSSEELVELIHQEDLKALAAVGQARSQIAAAIDLIVTHLRQSGRLFYVGAGTSGRLAALDAAECPPTFSVAPSLISALMAGGTRAFQRAVEGAEDDEDAARKLIRVKKLRPHDVLCGITASGTTPFVIGALNQAIKLACPTILITCGAVPANLNCDVVIHPLVGPEVLTGSTRMKAGLATKAVLHTLTTASMVRMGKVYDNLMVDVNPTNKKLVARATRIIQQVAQLDDSKTAAKLLKQANNQVKVAIVMAKRNLTRRAADELLRAHDNNLRQVIS